MNPVQFSEFLGISSLNIYMNEFYNHEILGINVSIHLQPKYFLFVCCGLNLKLLILELNSPNENRISSIVNVTILIASYTELGLGRNCSWIWIIF